MKTRRVAIYARVSTLRDQSTEAQVQELRDVAERAGWRVVQVYTDDGVPGIRAARPALNKLMADAARRRFDVLAAWSVDRLGRSVQNLCALLTELHSLGIDLYLHRQALDTTTPTGRAMFQMLGVFAEFEREMIRERTLAGLAKARRQGKRLGRPPIGDGVEDAIRALLDSGASYRAIASSLGCGQSVITRVRREAT